MQHQISITPGYLDHAASAFSKRSGMLSDLIFDVHCLNRHSTNLSILKYFDFQGFLITGQHSGTHWIKWMLSHALAHRYGVEPPRYFNNSSSNALIGHPRHPRRRPHLPRIASSHSIPPYAVVVRDVRDVLVSNYEKWRHDYAVPFSRYVEGDPRGKAYICDAWWYVRFLNQWGAIARRHPEQTLVLRYEDFRRDPLANLRALARHFSLDLSDDDLRAGIAVGSKDIMARHQDPEVNEKPVRPDGAGDTRFSAADLATLGAILTRHLKHDFGYAYFEQRRGYQIPGVRPERPVEAPVAWGEAVQTA